MNARAIDPRIVVVFVVLYATLVAVADAWVTLWLAVGFSVAALVLRGVRWRLAARRLSALALVLVSMWILVPIDVDPAAPWGWSWRWESAVLPARVTLRTCAIALMAMAMFEPIGVVGIVEGLRRLRVPDRLIRLMSLSARYSFVVRDEFKRLHGAMAARGYRLTATRAGYSGLATALGMLFVRSLDRSERVSRAIASRDTGGRVQAEASRWGRRDWLALASGAAMLALLAIAEWRVPLSLD